MNQTCSTLNVCVNGESQSISAPATLASLIALRRPRPPFAVELNRKLVRRANFETTAVSDGDSIEIVTLVGGG